MNTLLKITTSLNGGHAHSTQLADAFVARWRRHHSGATVIVRDLAADPVPHLTAERFGAFVAKPEARTPAQRTLVAHSDALIAELARADVVVLAAPMYNFAIPSTLKAYFDTIARAGLTFRYTAAGSEGLLRGKKAYVIMTRGGRYAAGEETESAYLRQMLGFIGIEDVEFVVAEGLALDAKTRDAALAGARAAIEKLTLRDWPLAA